MKQDNVIRILFIEDSIEDAEQIISLLRNNGIAVRPGRATNEAELETAIESLRPDLVLANPDARDLALRDVVQQMEASGNDVSVVVLTDNINDDRVEEWFVMKLRGVALRSRPTQLLHIIEREFDALSMRRRVRALETTLRESERRCDALLDSSRDPIAYVHEGMHVRANRAYLETFGYDSFDDIEGLTLLDMVSAKDADHFKALLKRLSRGEKPPQRVELTAVRADGTSFNASMEFAQATFEGEACLQVIFRRQVADEHLVEQLQRDGVTGIYNRTHTLELIDEAVTAAANGAKNQALLIVEPDNWRAAIDAVGLTDADALLKGIVERLRQQLSENDLIGRLGDQTLGILLRERTDESVRHAMGAMLAASVDSIYDAGEHSVSLSLSIGGSLLGEKNARAPQLIEQARNALRSAQTQGGNRSELHDPAAKEKAESQRDDNWLTQVRTALKDDGFILYYQQVVSLQDAEGEFYEVLLRMHGPGGEVLPNYFLPVAERAGLMPEIDRWVMDQAIDTLIEREREGRVSTFFIKLTLPSLQDESLLPWLEARLKESGLRHGALVLEMPESKVLTILKPAQEFVSRLKRAGGAFALEQFGSGLNSFQILKHVDAGYLKIDRSFMASLPENNENQQKIRDICHQAREHDKLTVAEWVEDATSTSLLFACGVDFVQGNFLQEPEKIISLDTAIV